MWQRSAQSLRRKFTFKDFKEAFAFMIEVGFYAEQNNHHPNWSNVYNTVTIELTTHDAGNIVTEKDVLLAEQIDKIYRKYSF